MIISGYHSLTSYPFWKGDFPYHLGPCPFPSFQHQTFVLRALVFVHKLVLSIRWTHWNHRVFRKTHKILVFMKIPHPNRAFSLWVFRRSRDHFFDANLVILTAWTGKDAKHDPWFQRTVWFMSTQNTEQFSVSLKEFDSWDQKIVLQPWLPTDFQQCLAHQVTAVLPIPSIAFELPGFFQQVMHTPWALPKPL